MANNGTKRILVGCHVDDMSASLVKKVYNAYIGTKFESI